MKLVLFAFFLNAALLLGVTLSLSPDEVSQQQVEDFREEAGSSLNESFAARPVKSVVNAALTSYDLGDVLIRKAIVKRVKEQAEVQNGTETPEATEPSVGDNVEVVDTEPNSGDLATAATEPSVEPGHGEVESKGACSAPGATCLERYLTELLWNRRDRAVELQRYGIFQLARQLQRDRQQNEGTSTDSTATTAEP